MNTNKKDTDTISSKDILFASVVGGISLITVVGSLITLNSFRKVYEANSQKEEFDPEIQVTFPEKSFEDKMAELEERKERRKVYEEEYNELSYKISENSLNVKDLKSFDFSEINYKISVVNQARMNNDVKIKELETELKLNGYLWRL